MRTHGDPDTARERQADAIAGQRTDVDTLIRKNRHAYYTQAKWTRVVPGGCKNCDYDPETGEFRDTDSEEYCWISMNVRYRSHRATRPVARVESSSGCG